MVSLFLFLAAEIVGLVVAEYGSPDNKHYAHSPLVEARIAHCVEVFRPEFLGVRVGRPMLIGLLGSSQWSR